MTNEDAIKTLRAFQHKSGGLMREAVDKAIEALERDRWIPFTSRPADEDEKRENPYWDYILTGPLPEDGQRILVNVVHRGPEPVQMDEWYDDCEGSYLDSGYDIGTEVTHWRPLPDPPKEET